MKSQKGFSLIELILVVVIVGLIATVSVPNLARA
ncbi:MAG: type II secretion system protein, partial [bacterium]|nr:type II secretion system protein [bacterium]